MAGTLERIPPPTKFCYMCNTEVVLEEIQRAEELFNWIYTECATETGRAVIMEVIKNFHEHNVHADNSLCSCGGNLYYFHEGSYALCMDCVVQVTPTARVPDVEHEEDSFEFEEEDDEPGTGSEEGF